MWSENLDPLIDV